MNGAKKPNLWPLNIQLCVCVCLCSRMLGLTRVSQEGHSLTPSFKRKILGRVGVGRVGPAISGWQWLLDWLDCQGLRKERAMCVCVIAWVGGGGVGVQGDMIDWKAAAKNRQTEVNALNEMNHY